MTSPLKEFLQVCSRVLLSLPANKYHTLNTVKQTLCVCVYISQASYSQFINSFTLRTKPGVSIMVRLGQ